MSSYTIGTHFGDTEAQFQATINSIQKNPKLPSNLKKLQIDSLRRVHVAQLASAAPKAPATAPKKPSIFNFPKIVTPTFKYDGKAITMSPIIQQQAVQTQLPAGDHAFVDSPSSSALSQPPVSTSVAEALAPQAKPVPTAAIIVGGTLLVITGIFLLSRKKSI